MPAESAKKNLTDFQPETYRIRIQGILNPSWSEWLECPEIIHTPTGETILHCLVADQTALHGLLVKIRDLNLKLISVTRIEVDE